LGATRPFELGQLVAQRLGLPGRELLAEVHLGVVLRRRGAMGVARQGRRSRSYAVHMGETEDAVSRRPALPGGTRFAPMWTSITTSTVLRGAATSTRASASRA